MLLQESTCYTITHLVHTYVIFINFEYPSAISYICCHGINEFWQIFPGDVSLFAVLKNVGVILWYNTQFSDYHFLKASSK